jgi:hypothetical protein
LPALKPVAARQLRITQEALRTKFAGCVRKDKAEAAEAVSLLEIQTQRRVVQERAKGGLVIEAAVFGNFPQRKVPKVVGEPIVPGFSPANGAGGEGEGGAGVSGGDAVETPSAEEAPSSSGTGGGTGREGAGGRLEAGSGDGDSNDGDDGGGSGGGGGSSDGANPDSTASRPRLVPWLDVTTATQFMVFDSHLDLHPGVHKADMLGFCDPCPEEDKFFRVRYRYRGRLHEVTVGEEDGVGLPNQSHQLPAEWQCPQQPAPAPV